MSQAPAGDNGLGESASGNVGGWRLGYAGGKEGTTGRMGGRRVALRPTSTGRRGGGGGADGGAAIGRLTMGLSATRRPPSQAELLLALGLALRGPHVPARLGGGVRLGDVLEGQSYLRSSWVWGVAGLRSVGVGAWHC